MNVNDPKGRQAAFNASSRDHWDGFAGHREKVAQLLGIGAGVGIGPRGGRACVLGAGNCNDLDLPALLEAHRALHLVDLDADALARGVARQGVAGHRSLHAHGGVDLTGMLDAIARWTLHATIGPADLAAMVEGPARRVASALPGPFDHVASTCLLRPLIGNAFHGVGEAHPQFPALVRAIRLGHLRLLTELAAHGGTATLITDVVSSDTTPTLRSLPDSALPGLLSRLARDRNFFHGVNPESLASLFRNDPVLKTRVDGLRSIPPWRWSLHSRLYLVWALRYRVDAPPWSSRPEENANPIVSLRPLPPRPSRDENEPRGDPRREPGGSEPRRGG